jgi:hypothetical protein
VLLAEKVKAEFMARAAWYDFIPDRYCYFCRKPTEEKVTVCHHVGDLNSDRVAIHAHLWCYRRRVGGMFLLFGATLLVTPLLLNLFEAIVVYKSYRFWVVLPNSLWIVNIVTGLVIGVCVGIELVRSYYENITHYVQVRTYPYP